MKLPVSTMASAAPAASVQGANPSALEDRGVRRRRRHAEGPQAADTVIEAKLPVFTTRQAVLKPLSARNVKGSSSTIQRMALRAARMARMTKANNHTRKGERSCVAIECLCKLDLLSHRDVSQRLSGNGY